MRSSLESNILVKPIQGRWTPRVDMSGPKEAIQEIFNGCADTANVGIDWRDHAWPQPRVEGTDACVIRNSDDQYRYLNLARFNADMNVLVLRNLEDVGPEVAHLMLRRRAALHTFLVSLDDLPDRSKKPQIYKGISAIPVPGKEDCFLFNTRAELAGPLNRSCPEERGWLSFHSLQCLHPQRILNLLQLVYLRKA